MIKRLIQRYWMCFVVAGLCLISVHAEAGDTLQYHSLERYELLEGEALRVAVAEYYDSINGIGNQTTKLEAAAKMFEFTSRKDELAHVRSLVFKARNTTPQQPQLLTQAFHIAKKHKRRIEMGLVEYNLSQFFMDCKAYDSAMFYILSYRDLAKQESEGEGYRNITNLLGDIYYYAGLYDQARDIYSGLLDQYLEEPKLDFYRPYVLMNDLGQITLKIRDYPLALDWFNRSLKMAEENLTTSYRLNTIAYTQIKIVETALNSGNIAGAGQWLSKVEEIPNDRIQTDVQQEYSYQKARFLLMSGHPDSALAMLKTLLPSDSIPVISGRFVPEIYHLLSEIYAKQGDLMHALSAGNMCLHLTDSLNAREHIARSMVILADRNHEITQNELRVSKQRISFLITGIGFLLFLLFITLIFYRKLYRTKLELVRKSLEEKGQPQIQPLATQDITSSGSEQYKESSEQEELIGSLIKAMENQKLFLNPGLNIQDVAKQLSTNRTYLSKAINNHLKTNFPGFINGYRVTESIRLITVGYANDHTIEALAESVGFANRNVFSAAFKKHTGVVPSFFIANYKRWDTQNEKFVNDD